MPLQSFSSRSFKTNGYRRKLNVRFHSVTDWRLRLKLLMTSVRKMASIPYRDMYLNKEHYKLEFRANRSDSNASGYNKWESNGTPSSYWMTHWPHNSYPDQRTQCGQSTCIIKKLVQIKHSNIPQNRERMRPWQTTLYNQGLTEQRRASRYSYVFKKGDIKLQSVGRYRTETDQSEESERAAEHLQCLGWEVREL